MPRTKVLVARVLTYLKMLLQSHDGFELSGIPLGAVSVKNEVPLGFDDVNLGTLVRRRYSGGSSYLTDCCNNLRSKAA